MIINRGRTRRPSKGSLDSTSGMLPGAASKHRERARTGLAAGGHHHGGPCPAVTLATLAGVSYNVASNALRPHGFRGRGMRVGAVDPVIVELTGRAATRVPFSHSGRYQVKSIVQNEMRGRDDWIRCKGHVMPVVNGELLYAAHEHRHATCTAAFMLED